MATKEEQEKMALGNLDADAAKAIEKLNNLVDTIAKPLRDAIAQAQNRPKNSTYDEKQLEDLQKKVMAQLDDLESQIKQKL